LRGAGSTGLAGMAAEADVLGVRVIRPLLGFTRQQLREVLASAGLTWREDASNQDQHYLRNALRMEVRLPDGGSFDYQAKVVKAQGYSSEELFEKRLLLLLPYYLMRYERSLEQIAASVHLSPSHISGLFRKETGQTVSAYIGFVRIEKSKQLLKTTQLSIAEIASRCGFEEQSYFSRVFRKQTGLSPKAYRDRSLD